MEPTTPFKLVVNVSAPAGAGLSYEADELPHHARHRRALSNGADRTLGTLKDLVETVERETPTGIHFSGHGMPGALQFESDEGLGDEVPVNKVLDDLRRRLPSGQSLPPFFLPRKLSWQRSHKSGEGKSWLFERGSPTAPRRGDRGGGVLWSYCR